MMLLLLPVGEVRSSVLDDLKSKLELEFHFKIKRTIPGELPDSLDSVRKQYRADSFFLIPKKQKYRADKILMITDVDLYAPGLNFIFGEAELGGKSALLSIHRLDPAFYGEHSPSLFRERVVKEAIHELGHTFGLSHCTNDCAMKFSSNILEVDSKPAKYCDTCRKKMDKFFK